jgi:hypothetical protein
MYVFPALCPADPEKPETVLVLSMAGCCADRYWAQGEASLLDELATLNAATGVVPFTPASTDNPEPLFRSLAASRKAAFVVRLFKDGPTDGWGEILSSAPAEGPVFRRMHFVIPDGEDGSATAVLRIVEAIRAGMLTLEQKATPQPGTGTEPAEPPPTHAHLTVFAEPTIFGGPGGLPPFVGARAGLTLQPMDHLLIEAHAQGGPASRRISNDGDAASLLALMSRGFLYWVILPDSNPVPAIGLGAGVAWFRADGRSDTAAANRTDRDSVAYLGAAVRLEFDVSRRLALVLGGRIGFLFPEVTCVLRDTPSGSVGRPLLEVGLALELTVF